MYVTIGSVVIIRKRSKKWESPDRILAFLSFLVAKTAHAYVWYIE